MKHTKTIIFLLFLAGAVTVQAQTRLDEISFNLPDKAGWTQLSTSFKNDSTQRKQLWGNKSDSLILAIRSIDRTEVKYDYKAFKQRVAHKLGLKPIEEGAIESQYPYTLYKVDFMKWIGKQGSGLALVMQTPTSIHMAILGQVNAELTPVFMKQWTAVLTHPIITPGKDYPVKKTVFVMHSPKANRLQGTLIQQRLIRAFESRLRDLYERKLTAHNVDFKGHKIYLALRGPIDSAKVATALSLDKTMAVYPILPIKNKTKLIQGVDQLAFPNAEKEDIAEIRADYKPALSFVTGKTITKVRNFTQTYLTKHELMAIKIFESSDYAMFSRLYLLNTAHQLADETSIMQLERVKVNDTPVLKIHLDPEARKNLKLWTQKHPSGYLAIVIDGRVYATPKINGKISNGVISLNKKLVSELFYIYYALVEVYPTPIKVTEIAVNN